MFLQKLFRQMGLDKTGIFVDRLFPDFTGSILSQPFGQRVNRQDPAKSQRIRAFVIFQGLSFRQEFDIRMMDFPYRPKTLYFSGDNNFLAGIKPLRNPGSGRCPGC